MESEGDETKRVRSAALQNASAILHARQRAERELLEAKEALERKTEELAGSLAMMRATLESTTNAILVTDANGEITGYNQRLIEMWTIPREAIETGDHRRVLDVTSDHFADPFSFRARIEQIYETSPPETYDLLELEDGRMVERFSKPQRIEDRNVGRVWSFRDITAQKHAERELREQSEWLSVTLGSIGDAVVAVNTDCVLTFLNPVAEKLSGWTNAEALGRPLGEVLQMLNEKTREPVEIPIHRALVEGVVLGLANHTRLVRRDGSEIPIEDSAAPIRNGSGAIIGAVMVFHDVTERRQRDLALQRSYVAEQEARAVAEQANQAKDHFLAALSHELRTPLTPVLAILSSLRQESAIPEALADDLETVRRNIELEARLIDDLLDLTRITRGKLYLHHEHVSAGRIIEDAVNTCLPDLRAKRLTLKREVAQPHPVLYVDSARTTQILWNLLKNAIKFTPPEGTITLRSRISGEGGDQMLTIEVADTGIGMEPGDAERIFKAFEQGNTNTARQFGGLGLGLAISRAIAESHRGALIGSSKGKNSGSTFTLTLPCATGAAGVSEASRPPLVPSLPTPVPGSLLQRPLRILLVEDHADTAAILTRLLRRMGHDVLHANSVAMAIEMADREMAGGSFDLLMSDLGLPDGTGQDLMRTLSARYPLKGIALSGYGMESDVEESAAAGFSRHLIKPIDIALLKSTIAELMLS